MGQAQEQRLETPRVAVPPKPGSHSEPAPQVAPIPAGPGGGDPKAAYDAFSHFTDAPHAAEQRVKLDPKAQAGADTQKVLAYIQAQARAMAKQGMVIDKDSMFYERMSQHYLKDYLANPNAQTGHAAVDKIGEQFDPAKADPNDYWEKNSGYWNAHKVPSGMKLLLGNGAPETMGAATAALSQENRQHLPYLDVPQLVGSPNTGTGEDADVFGGGKNISQLMHWATGVKYADKDPNTMRDLFLAYENYHLEGWDTFGEDSINDMISEDAGRIMGRQLQGGQLNQQNLQGKLSDGFNESRAWVGSLIKSRQGQLDKMITAPEAPVSHMWWNKENKSMLWGDKSIQQELLAGKTPEEIEKDPKTQHLAQVYSLIYYSENWQKEHGKIKHSNFTDGMLEGRYDKVFEKSVKDEPLTGKEKVDAYLDAKAPWVPEIARPMIQGLAGKMGADDPPKKQQPKIGAPPAPADIPKVGPAPDPVKKEAPTPVIDPKGKPRGSGH